MAEALNAAFAYGYVSDWAVSHLRLAGAFNFDGTVDKADDTVWRGNCFASCRSLAELASSGCRQAGKRRNAVAAGDFDGLSATPKSGGSNTGAPEHASSLAADEGKWARRVGLYGLYSSCR